MKKSFNILDWDSTFFGFNVASLTVQEISTSELISELELMRKKAIHLAYWKRPTLLSGKIDQCEVVLADMPCTYILKNVEAQTETSREITLYSKTQLTPDLKDVAIQCGTFSRFNNDDKIPHQKFVELYTMWIQNSILKKIANDVLVYSVNDKIVGLITLVKKNKTGHIGLLGVHSDHRGMGIGSQLVKAAVNYFAEKGCTEVEVVTQQNNMPACKTYEHAGFTIKDKNYYYHIWL